MSNSYTFCTTVNAVESSLQTLRRAEFLVVDCEGRHLGTRYGALSTLAIGTSRPSEISVYDAVVLDCAALLPVLELLSDPAVIKVVWDGRMDFSEIFYTYGKRIENVLDMQIVEIMSRQKRGETESRRVKNYLRPYIVLPWKEEYEGINIVVGMKRCLEKQGLALGDGKDPGVQRIHKQNLSELWMKRPLATDLLNYAAKDIHLIRLIYIHFKHRGHLDSMAELREQSQRYVSMHDDLESKPLEQDKYRCSAVLPLDILERPTGMTRRKCDKCYRYLSMPCFLMQGEKYNKVCKVCHIVAIKYGLQVDEKYE